MQRDRRNETARFMQAIAAFSASIDPGEEQGRRISASQKAAVSAMLAEIAETVLRRHVTFVSPSGVEVTLDVAERRVHRVLAIPIAWRSDFRELIGQDLTAGHGPELLQLFMTLSDGSGDLYVQTGLPDRKQAAGYSGVTVRELENAQDLWATLVPLPAQLRGVTMRALVHARACVIVNNGTLLQGFGDARDQATLRSLCDGAVTAGGEGPFVRLWHAGWVPDCAVVMVHAEPATVAVLIPSDQMVSLFSDFNATLTGWAEAG